MVAYCIPVQVRFGDDAKPCSSVSRDSFDEVLKPARALLTSLRSWQGNGHDHFLAVASLLVTSFAGTTAIVPSAIPHPLRPGALTGYQRHQAHCQQPKKPESRANTQTNSRFMCAWRGPQPRHSGPGHPCGTGCIVTVMTDFFSMSCVLTT